MPPVRVSRQRSYAPPMGGVAQLHEWNQHFTWSLPDGPLRRLTRDQRDEFDRDGFVVLRATFDAGDIERLTGEIDEWERTTQDFLSRRPEGTMFIATKDEITFTVHLVTRSPEARRFVAHDALRDICHDLIGARARLYWDQAVYKHPEPDREFPWHQDNGYAFVEPQQYLTCWVPLTTATIDNGCPWVAPGWHRGGTLVHRMTPVGLQCFDDPPRAIPVEAEPGDVVVFSSLTPHRTGPNRTDTVRKAYICQYAPDGAVVLQHASDGTIVRVPQDDPARQFALSPAGGIDA
jgi:phytanoyl-CoA hydroxylase